MKKTEKYNKAYICMLIIQIIFLLTSVLFDNKFGIDRLTAKQTINVAFDLFAMICIIIIFVSCIIGRKNDSTFSFMLLAFFVDICLYCEHGSWVVDKIASMRTANYIFNIGSNSSIIIICGLFYYFACKSLKIDMKKYKRAENVLIVVIALSIIAEIINIFFGFYYYIDKYGVYARNIKGSLISYIPFIYALGFTSFVVINQKISSKLKGIYLTYILVPFIISIWYTVSGMPPTFFVSSFLSIALIYANIYVGLGRETTRYELANAYNEVELALQKNKLTLSQIKPHFIFNALGSIEELCYEDKDKAGEAVHYFAKYLRTNMDALGEKDTITFQNELDHIRNYIWLEKMRFDDELEYIEDIKADNFLIPTLCVQPLVENAVKHGMMGKYEGVLTVQLVTRETDDSYIIQIIDDGCGFDVNEKKDDGRSHIGLTYSKTCLEKKMGGTIEVESIIGTGTTITMHIPKITKKDI